MLNLNCTQIRNSTRIYLHYRIRIGIIEIKRTSHNTTNSYVLVSDIYIASSSASIHAPSLLNYHCK